MTETNEAATALVRPAATLVALRDSAEGPADILFVERAKGMAFAGGAVVFPGGALDPRDAVLAQSIGDHGLDDAPWRICAIRETVEESGLALGFAETPDPEWCRMAQTALHDGADFADLLHQARLSLDLSALEPFAHWRPRHRERRVFDTRFYIVRAAADVGEPIVDATENVLSYWTSAQRMLSAADAGETKVIFPTRRNLEKLALCPSYEAARAHVRAFPPREISPWLEDRDGARWLCIPDDLGYPVTAERIDTAIRG